MNASPRKSRSDGSRTDRAQSLVSESASIDATDAGPVGLIYSGDRDPPVGLLLSIHFFARVAASFSDNPISLLPLNVAGWPEASRIDQVPSKSRCGTKWFMPHYERVTGHMSNAAFL